MSLNSFLRQILTWHIYRSNDDFILTKTWLRTIVCILCTEAETGYFGGWQAVKGEESQYSLTEALCLFWVLPWGLHSSRVTNIHIIDRVLYCRMAFLSPIIENWLWKWYRGIEKNTFSSYFFFHAFSAHFVHSFYNMYEMYESIYVEIMIMPRVKGGQFCFEKSEAEKNFLTFWWSPLFKVFLVI